MESRFFVLMLISIVDTQIEQLSDIHWITKDGDDIPTLKTQFQNETLIIPLQKAPFCRLTITHRCDCFVLREDENTSDWQIGSFVYCNGKVHGYFMDETDIFKIAPSNHGGSTPEHLVIKLEAADSTEGFDEVSFGTSRNTRVTTIDFHFFKPLPEFLPLGDNETGYVDCFFALDRKIFETFGDYNMDMDIYLQMIINWGSHYYLQFNIILIYQGWTYAFQEHTGRKGLDKFLEYGFSRYEKEAGYNTIILLAPISSFLVGYAEIDSMCRDKYGIFVKYYEYIDALGFRSQIMALMHEIGHQFGFFHTDQNGCTVKEPPNILYIMRNVSTWAAGKLKWSSCTIESMKENRHKRFCLRRKPSSYQTICGNGIVEQGEECDCILKICRKCCDKKCRFTQGSICSNGPCCDLSTCMAKKGIQCREARDSCDIPELCNGTSGECPPNYVVANGYRCTGTSGKGYCFDGRCGSHQDVCRWIFVNGYHPKNECYSENLDGGSRYGGCGPVYPETDDVSRCTDENKLCGKVWCKSHGNSDSTSDFKNTSKVYAALWLIENERKTCYTLRLNFTKYLAEDPTFVHDGSECGDGRMCNQQKCVALPPGCPEDCPGEKITHPYTGEKLPAFILVHRNRRKRRDKPSGNYFYLYLISVLFPIFVVIVIIYKNTAYFEEIRVRYSSRRSKQAKRESSSSEIHPPKDTPQGPKGASRSSLPAVSAQSHNSEQIPSDEVIKASL